MRGTLPGPAPEQVRRWVQHEPQEPAALIAQIEGAFEGAPGGGLVAERISPRSRSGSPWPRTCSAGPVSPRRTRAGTSHARVAVASGCCAARCPASRSAAGRHRCRADDPFEPALGQTQVPLGRLQRPVRQLVGRGQRRQLGIRRASLGGEPSQERVHGRGPSGQMQAGPVVGQQPGGQPPVPRGLGMPDRLKPLPQPRTGHNSSRTPASDAAGHGPELSAGRIAHSRTNLSTCVPSARVAPALTSALAQTSARRPPQPHWPCMSQLHQSTRRAVGAWARIPMGGVRGPRTQDAGVGPSPRQRGYRL